MEPVERPGLRIEGGEQSAGTPPAAALPTASEANAAVGIDANPSDTHELCRDGTFYVGPFQVLFAPGTVQQPDS